MYPAVAKLKYDGSRIRGFSQFRDFDERKKERTICSLLKRFFFSNWGLTSQLILGSTQAIFFTLVHLVGCLIFTRCGKPLTTEWKHFI
jgi:hypothetical protein